MSQHPQLDSSIAESRKKGMTDGEIKAEAIKVGWSSADIDAAFMSMVVATTPRVEKDQVPPVAVAPVNPTYVPPPVSSSHGKKTIGYAAIGILIILLLGGGVYAYVENIGPFGKAPYQEDNLMTGLLSKFAQIESSSYGVSAKLYAEPRDADAKPFSAKITDDEELKLKYYRDSQRAASIQDALSYLAYDSQGFYPASLNSIKNSTNYYGASNMTLTDPLTKAPYVYQVTENGNNFALTVTFETADAISTIRSYQKYNLGEKKDESSTIIKGKTVIFTKNSYSYLYLPIEPPQTLLESLGEFTEYLPPEINVQGSINATAAKNEGDKKLSEWKFGLDGSGDFGDLTYKINIEALKNDKDYYLRINNLPSLLAGLLPPKGQWVKFSSDAAEGDEASYSIFPSSEDIAEYEEDYKENRAATVDFIKKMSEFADQEKLLAFKDKPHKEKIDGRSLYQYDVRVRKEAVLPFYKKLMEEASKNPEVRDNLLMIDEGYLNYLESPAFSETFDYYDKNIDITLWTDEKGFPAMAKYSIRIVPPDENIALKDKQIMLDLTLSIDNINEPVNIDAPEGAKTYKELMSGTDNPLSSARGKAENSMAMSYISSLRAQSELVYEDNGGYGTKAFALGPCAKTEGTLFGNQQVYDLISSAAKEKVSSATCISEFGSGGNVSVYAVSVPLPTMEGYSYCVDSTGRAKEILGSITTSSCN